MSKKKAWNYTISDNRYLEINERVAPIVDIHAEPVRCYRVNHEWSIFVAGAISELINFKAWQGIDSERQNAIQQLLKMLEGEDCMDCQDVLNCVNADSDYIALSTQIFNQAETDTQSYLDDLNTAYDGTPQSIGANIPTGTPDTTEQNALCYALEQFIKLYASVKASKINEKNSLQILWARIKQFTLGLFGVAKTILGFILDSLIGSCVPDDDTALIALQDDTALLDVACCLLDELETVTISETVFNTAISTCATNLTGTAKQIACLLQADNELPIYLFFLDAYNIALQRQIDGETLTCNCELVGCVEYDFTIDAQGWQVWSTGGRAFGVHVPGVGWQCTYNSVSGAGNDNRIYIENLNWVQQTAVKRIESDVIPTAGGSARSDDGRVQSGTGSIENHDLTPQTVINSTLQTVGADFSSTGDGVRVLFTTNTGASADQDAITIQKIRVYYGSGQPEDGQAC